jgi:leader peptidase (prepilin peptidase)/N-methyltransferase
MMEQEFRSECCDFLTIHDEKIKQSKDKKITLSTPNSTCPSCQTPIKPWHNIPVFSYLFLRGKCASCKTHISIRYPIIEAITGLLSVLTIYLLGFNGEGLVALVLLWSLMSVTMIDIDTQFLPDNITLPLLWLGRIANYFGLYTSLGDALLGAIFGYLYLWFVYWLFNIVTG